MAIVRRNSAVGLGPCVGGLLFLLVAHDEEDGDAANYCDTSDASHHSAHDGTSVITAVIISATAAAVSRGWTITGSTLCGRGVRQTPASARECDAL